MPGGSAGGARGCGRFYRNAAASLTNSLSQVSFDTVSAILPPELTDISGGSIQTSVAGAGIVLFAMRASGLLSLTGVRIEMTRSPGTARELVFTDCVLRAPAAGVFCLAAPGSVFLDVDDTVRIRAAVEGISTLDLIVGSELNTWAHLIVG